MAGNARFHDKLHRKNHHTNPTVGFADSASDPIASPSEPFQGDFVVNGKLSASNGIDILSANISGDIYCNNIHVSSVTYTNWISGNSTESIISDGALTGNGDNTLTLNYQKGIYGISPFFSISNTLCSLGTITSPVATFDTLTVKTSTNLNGPLSVFGNTNLNGTLTVTGSSTINGKLSVGSDVNVNGNLLVSGNLSALGGTTQIDTTIVTTSAMIIDTLGTTDALRVTQRGTGNALIIEDSINPDSNPFVVDADGNVLIGLSATYASPFNHPFQISRAGSSGITLARFTNSGVSPVVRFAKSRGTVNGTFGGGLSAGDNIGVLDFYGDSGALSATRSAWIAVDADGLFTDSSVPSRFGIATTASGSTTPTERLRINNAGNVGIGTSNPTGTLHVNASSTAPVVKISQFGSTGHALYVEDESGDGTPTVIDYAGHMGIGTTTPNKELTVVGDISATGTIYTHSSSYSLSSTGYTKLPNGIIMQWGRIYTPADSLSTYNVDVVFPIQFSNQCFNFVASVGVSITNYDEGSYRNDSQEISYGTPSISGCEGQVFLYTALGNGRIIQWQAMGY